MLMLASTVCGFIFGWGLLISGMMQPAKVISFLTSSARGTPASRW